MSAASAAKLYTSDLLALAVQLAKYSFDPTLPIKGEARSRTCGSTLEIGIAVDHENRIETVGLRVTACAVGQASAAIFANAAVGQMSERIASTLSQIEYWLAGKGDMPEWPGFSALLPAREHAGRHGAILLPWRASTDALCKAGQAG